MNRFARITGCGVLFLAAAASEACTQSGEDNLTGASSTESTDAWAVVVNGYRGNALKTVCVGALVEARKVVAPGDCIVGMDYWDVAAPNAKGKPTMVATAAFAPNWHLATEKHDPTLRNMGVITLPNDIKISRYPQVAAPDACIGCDVQVLSRYKADSSTPSRMLVHASSPRVAVPGAAFGARNTIALLPKDELQASGLEIDSKDCFASKCSPGDIDKHVAKTAKIVQDAVVAGQSNNSAAGTGTKRLKLSAKKLAFKQANGGLTVMKSKVNGGLISLILGTTGNSALRPATTGVGTPIIFDQNGAVLQTGGCNSGCGQVVSAGLPSTFTSPIGLAVGQSAPISVVSANSPVYVNTTVNGVPAGGTVTTTTTLQQAQGGAFVNVCTCTQLAGNNGQSVTVTQTIGMQTGPTTNFGSGAQLGPRLGAVTQGNYASPDARAAEQVRATAQTAAATGGNVTQTQYDKLVDATAAGINPDDLSGAEKARYDRLYNDRNYDGAGAARDLAEERLAGMGIKPGTSVSTPTTTTAVPVPRPATTSSGTSYGTSSGTTTGGTCGRRVGLQFLARPCTGEDGETDSSLSAAAQVSGASFGGSSGTSSSSSSSSSGSTSSSGSSSGSTSSSDTVTDYTDGVDTTSTVDYTDAANDTAPVSGTQSANLTETPIGSGDDAVSSQYDGDYESGSYYDSNAYSGAASYPTDDSSSYNDGN